MKNIKILFSILLGFFLAISAMYVVWILIRQFIFALSRSSPEVSAAVIGSMATITVGIAVVSLTQRHERRRASDEAHRLKKVELYRGFIEIVARMTAAKNERMKVQAPTEDELLEFGFKFKSELLLWGSPQVIKAYIAFEDAASEGSSRTLKYVDKLYVEIRSDLGLSNSGLANNELVKINLKDRKDFDKLVK